MANSTVAVLLAGFAFVVTSWLATFTDVPVFTYRGLDRLWQIPAVNVAIAVVAWVFVAFALGKVISLVVRPIGLVLGPESALVKLLEDLPAYPWDATRALWLLVRGRSSASWLKRLEGDERHQLEDELHAEVEPGHRLFAKPVSALGRCVVCAEVVFTVTDDPGWLASVRLTGSGLPGTPPLPKTRDVRLTLLGTIREHEHWRLGRRAMRPAPSGITAG